ncbi:TlpA family protein disulfide reductase [Mucilaginibacter robiniae]|uniref:TlpA family protein disulfide reductase n=1 Tax=Mucilaginibacter robiniae TaxID=2728022 RepID=A0A7L5E2W1_9SPHI|nr:TlpA disulfide reductase family protein [Mucilaginibacter robiniae]QJD97720.1 TlpA family protein disulfide reductase [Mucilaginibacter robiniae]
MGTDVSLRSEEAVTTVTNQTNDTIKLKGVISFYLPVSEKVVEEVIDPGKSATFKIKMNYPDFIQFTSLPFRIYNAPGKTVKCTIESDTPLKLSFTGDLSAENNYYSAYFQGAQSNQIYYQVGNQIKDFNKFPALADSINRINLNFLENYKQPLSSTFKKQEYWRLMYNNAFLKHHVPFDKAFKSGQKIRLDDKYFNFDSETPLVGQAIPLSTEYLWYAVFRLRDIAINESKADSLLSVTMLAAAQDKCGKSEIGDVVKMRLLYDAYARSKINYEKLLRQVTFVNPENKRILDSISNARFSLPLTGKKAPEFRLVSITGDTVELSQFADHLIVVNFWASWCAPCIQEFPLENKLYDTYKASKNLVVINVCIDSPIDAWKNLSAKHQLKMVNLFADDIQGKYLKKKYNISTLPKSVFIDRKLKIINNNFKRASQIKLQDLE